MSEPPEGREPPHRGAWGTVLVWLTMATIIAGAVVMIVVILTGESTTICPCGGGVWRVP